MKNPSRKRQPRKILGWREVVALPDLGVPAIEAKLDTGARTSALHAEDVSVIDAGDDTIDPPRPERVSFRVAIDKGAHPRYVAAEADLLARRWVRSSNGSREERPVIETHIAVAGRRWKIEVTLTRRDDMGFQMLVGRQALRGRFVVEPGSSYRGKALAAAKRAKASKKADVTP